MRIWINAPTPQSWPVMREEGIDLRAGGDEDYHHLMEKVGVIFGNTGGVMGSCGTDSVPIWLLEKKPCPLVV